MLGYKEHAEEEDEEEEEEDEEEEEEEEGTSKGASVPQRTHASTQAIPIASAEAAKQRSEQQAQK